MSKRETIDYSLRLYLSLLSVLLTLLLFFGLALFRIIYFFWYVASFINIIAVLCQISLFFLDHTLKKKEGRIGRKIGLRSTILPSFLYILSSFLLANEGITRGRDLWSPNSDPFVNVSIVIIGIGINFLSLFVVTTLIGSMVVLLVKTKNGSK